MRNANMMTTCALFVALTAVCAQIQIPIQPIVLNLALLAVHLCAALLLPRQAALTMTAYLLMGALGLPVFAGLRGGIGVLMDRTGGYIVGYVLSAWITGMLMRCWGRGFLQMCLAMAVGTLLCYTIGTAWFAALTSAPLWTSLTLCVLPFIPGDAAKILLAAYLAKRLEGPIKKIL